MKRAITIPLLLLLCTAVGKARTNYPAANVAREIEPFRQYYASQTEWPRGSGWKPFKRIEWDLLPRGLLSTGIPMAAYWEAMHEKRHMPRIALDEPWVNLGPFNHGGRARIIAFHPQNPMIMFAGCIAGGLFRSTDAGENWQAMTDDVPNLNVSCLAIDANHPDVMFLGTGDGFWNPLTGIGLLKSTDGGVTWDLTALRYPYPSRANVACVDVDPRDGNIVLAATNDSIYRSTDGGMTFAGVFGGSVRELVRDPHAPDNVLCAIWNPWGGSRTAIYRSTDNGLTWERSFSGLPMPLEIGRIKLAFSPSHPQIVYAGMTGTFAGNHSSTLGVYRSTDGGIAWREMSGHETDIFGGQGWFCMAFAVKPDDPDVLYAGGLDIYRSMNSGQRWRNVSQWMFPVGDRYVHADHHAFAFHPDRPNEIWVGCDGGIFKSTDGGDTWTEKNRGFVTYMYYGIGTAARNSMIAYGGSIDNGTSAWYGDNDFLQVLGADGGQCVVDYTNDSVVYAEYQLGDRFRSDDGGRTFRRINYGVGLGPWVAPLALDPFDHNTIYTTTDGDNGAVWKSPNRGDPIPDSSENGGRPPRNHPSWVRIGLSIGGYMQTLAVSPTVPGRLYLGTGTDVFRFDPSDSLWIRINGDLPAGWITRLVPDLDEADGVYALLADFNHGHVFHSTQAGNTWTDVSGNLPDVPCGDLIINPNDPLTLYVATDIGVYATTDGGQTWAVFGDGLPNVRVDDLELQVSTGLLRAGSHGRGLWEIPTDAASLTLLYPNGVETLVPGQEAPLRWTTADLGGDIRIELNRSYPSDEWETLFASTPNDGIETWPVSEPETHHGRFRIRQLTVAEQADTSNADTPILIPGIRILHPNGGEILTAGALDTVRVEWINTNPLLFYVRLNRDYPEGSWEYVSRRDYGAPLGSVYVWPVGLPFSSRVRIRVEVGGSNGWPLLTDESDGDFAIREPVLRIDKPEAGDVLFVGEPYFIQWFADSCINRICLMIHRGLPESHWETIACDSAPYGVRGWIPTEPASPHCRLLLRTYEDYNCFVETPGEFTILPRASEIASLPTAFRIHGPYPNPFNAHTHIDLDLPSAAEVSINVYNRLGQHQMTVADGLFSAGVKEFVIDGSPLPSGLYFIRIEAASDISVLKSALVK